MTETIRGTRPACRRSPWCEHGAACPRSRRLAPRRHHSQAPRAADRQAAPAHPLRARRRRAVPRRPGRVTPGSLSARRSAARLWYRASCIGTELRTDGCVNNEHASGLRSCASPRGLATTRSLWTEPDYAAASPYGTLIAPPSFIFAWLRCDRPHGTARRRDRHDRDGRVRMARQRRRPALARRPRPGQVIGAKPGGSGFVAAQHEYAGNLRAGDCFAMT
jgi:hypothetical protein